MPRKANLTEARNISGSLTCLLAAALTIAPLLSAQQQTLYAYNWLLTARHVQVEKLASQKAIDDFLKYVKLIFDIEATSLDGMQDEIERRRVRLTVSK